ncbi:MAG: hypothetical protein ABW171_18105 [Steroidobacter sp.]
MPSATRMYMSAILLSVGLAGCTPAHFVQRARPVQRCEVQMCVNLGTGLARCECKTHEQLIRQTRHGFWPHAER